ncbi:hypothetical protein NQ314_004777 [Rhamnusium bicolor]|uniref:CS domain-containing protein n=1 Tax=Rhamnusium bicolor TaxID=1586634 RepID=A0AAV8ZIU1_9CUCU|nr:hypothetical protein NQ314_004777 [Rhamnusium bicolor]
MPVIIKDYIWRQTTNDIVLQIPLRGVHKSKVDIFTSQRYIKATFGYNFFEVILLHSINVQESKYTITQSHIVFELKKTDATIWEFLEPNIPKNEKVTLIKQLIDDEHFRYQTEMNEKVNKAAEIKRVAVREQIEIDSKNRQIIENIKKQEEAKTLGDLNQWTDTILQKKIDIIKNQCSNSKKRGIAQNKVKEEIVPIPSPRLTNTLLIDFTPREFPTPSRESKLDEENEWLRKYAEARRSSGFNSDDIRPEEKNPQFLKAKGDEFLRNKNYLGAISAYSFGIKLCRKFVDLYIARSEVHLILGNFNKAIQDCSTALDLLKPEVPQNLKERALCIGRRGVALCKIDLIKQGIGELQISLKLVPNECFKTILEEVKINHS